jgi:hypothetical protein
MSAERFDWRGVVARGLFSLFVVFAVYNPSGTSYLHWVAGGFELFWAKLAVGAFLLAVLWVLWRTTLGVLKPLGVGLMLAICLGAGATIIGATGNGIFEGNTLLMWLLVSLAALFTAGLCYSHLHHRLGGISHTEEIK